MVWEERVQLPAGMGWLCESGIWTVKAARFGIGACSFSVALVVIIPIVFMMWYGGVRGEVGPFAQLKYKHCAG